MKKILVLLGSAALGLAAYLVLKAPAPESSTDDVDKLGNRVGSWGAKKRVTGAGDSISGHLKDAAGSLVGSDELQAEGAVDKVTGAVEDTAGKAANAVSGALHELNR